LDLILDQGEHFEYSNTKYLNPSRIRPPLKPLQHTLFYKNKTIHTVVATHRLRNRHLSNGVKYPSTLPTTALYGPQHFPPTLSSPYTTHDGPLAPLICPQTTIRRSNRRRRASPMEHLQINDHPNRTHPDQIEPAVGQIATSAQGRRTPPPRGPPRTPSWPTITSRTRPSAVPAWR
jgi:hypothetical protein